MKLTATTITKIEIPAGRSERFAWDDEIAGFGIRLREGGSRTWVFQYKLGAKHRRMTFGSVDAMTAQKARERAGELHAQYRLGQDPAAQKHEARTRAADTVEPLLREFLEHQQTKKRKDGSQGLKPRTYVEVERHLLKDAKVLHGLRIDVVDQKQIAAVLDAIGKENPTTANRVRASLSAFFNWALKRGHIKINPAALTDRNAEHARNRVLNRDPKNPRNRPDELRVIWNALPAGDYGDILKLLLLTGCRRDEIGSLRWDEIADDGTAIELPGERTKNGRPHRVHLSAPARAILKARKKVDGRELVFGIGDGPFAGWSNSKERLDADLARICKEQGRKPLPEWHLHDLRRTLATLMAEDLKVAPHIIEALINHVSGHKAGVAGTYNWATYDEETAAALDAWGRHVLALVAPRKTASVTTLRA
jgi:integrase